MRGGVKGVWFRRVPGFPGYLAQSQRLVDNELIHLCGVDTIAVSFGGVSLRILSNALALPWFRSCSLGKGQALYAVVLVV